jgi:hypothetical protein
VEELLVFASQAIACLLQKTLEGEADSAESVVSKPFLDRIFTMLLSVQSKTVREKLCHGLHSALSPESSQKALTEKNRA